jgi:lipoic acid synthetase
VLSYAKNRNFRVKTGIMLGLGETKEEVFNIISDIRKLNADILTIGQYMPPTKEHYPVIKEYSPEEFKEFETYAASCGIKHTACGRYVRSSYLADEHFKQYNTQSM